MSRSAHSPAMRTLPRVWVLYLLHKFDCGLPELNMQLTLPPSPSLPFRFGSTPKPMTLRVAPRMFELAFRRGSNPDYASFHDPDFAGEKFNLFLRVAEHVPGSEDWLFREIAPYLSTSLPPVNYAAGVVNECLERLELKRPSAATVEAARIARYTDLTRIERNQIAALTAAPDPIHVVLLIALFHERQWHNPWSTEAHELYNACVTASISFTRRPEFETSDTARQLARNMRDAINVLLKKIKREGHRSMVPPAISGYSCKQTFFCLPFKHFDDADLCVSITTSLSIDQMLHGRSTIYSPGSNIPNTNQSLEAMQDLFSHSVLSEKRIKSYSRAEPWRRVSG